MSEVLKSANSYLKRFSNKTQSKTIKEKLARFSDPFISSDGDLCIKLRTYDRTKKIKGINVRTHGIVVNLDNGEISDIIDYLEDIVRYKDVLKEVANERRKRREVYMGKE